MSIDKIHPGLRHLAVPIESLADDPRNANTHGERNLNAIAESFERFGQRKPLVVRREGRVIEAGNGAKQALMAKGWTHIAVVECDDDADTAMAYALADNQSARLSDWNFQQLGENLAELIHAGWDAGVLGWDDASELDALLRGESYPLPETEAAASDVEASETPDSAKADESPTFEQSDEVPEVSEVDPVTEPGDVWLLGNHRLICGDCRDPEVVARLLGDVKINVAFTSPPYASQRKYDESSGFKPISPDEFVDWFDAVQANVRAHLADDGSWFVNIKPASEGLDTQLYVFDLVLAHVRRWGWHFATELCWQRKGLPGYPRRRFKNQFEPVYQFALNDWKFRPEQVMHASSSAFKYSADNPGRSNLETYAGQNLGTRFLNEEEGMAYPGNRLPLFEKPDVLGHTAVFAVGLPRFFVLAYSDEGDAIFDPFSGSGTTIIACERTGRRGFGCEISPRYCDMIVARWERETGKKAERVRASG